MGGEKWPGCVCVNVTADATTGATALLLPAHVNMSRSHRNAAHARTARRLTLPRPPASCMEVVVPSGVYIPVSRVHYDCSSRVPPL